MKQLKKCKAINKAIGFDGCGDEVFPNTRKYGLCKKCYPKWLSSDLPNAKNEFNKFVNWNRKNYEKEQKRKSKEEREKIIEYNKKLQDKINAISRLIDKGQPCLARGYHANQLHGGHVYSRGSHQSMRYNLHNIHRQSAQSNHYQNEDGLLREGLVKEYGVEYFDFLTSLRGTPSLKYTNSEYKEFYKTACSLFNELKKQGRVNVTPKERIILRNEINNLLGIYETEYCNYNLK